MFKDEEKLQTAEHILELYRHFLDVRSHDRLIDQEDIPTFNDFMVWVENEYDQAVQPPESKEKI